MADNPNYYAILTADVRYDTTLSSTAKLIYAEITALTSKFGYCTAKNKYFAELYGIECRSVQRIIAQLSVRNFIRVETEGRLRKIFIVDMTKMSYMGDKNVIVEGDKNVTHNNTSINNIYNKYNICSEQGSDQPAMLLPLNDRTEYPLSQNYIDEMSGLYPNTDVMAELRKMRAWLINNPSRRKTKKGIQRFINSWLMREQDRNTVQNQGQVSRSGTQLYSDEDGDDNDWCNFTVER